MLKSRLPKPISSVGRSAVEVLPGKMRPPVSRDVSSSVEPGYACSAAMNSSLRQIWSVYGCGNREGTTHKGRPIGSTPVSVVA